MANHNKHGKVLSRNGKSLRDALQRYVPMQNRTNTPSLALFNQHDENSLSWQPTNKQNLVGKQAFYNQKNLMKSGTKDQKTSKNITGKVQRNAFNLKCNQIIIATIVIQNTSVHFIDSGFRFMIPNISVDDLFMVLINYVDVAYVEYYYGETLNILFISLKQDFEDNAKMRLQLDLKADMKRLTLVLNENEEKLLQDAIKTFPLICTKNITFSEAQKRQHNLYVRKVVPVEEIGRLRKTKNPLLIRSSKGSFENGETAQVVRTSWPTGDLKQNSSSNRPSEWPDLYRESNEDLSKLGRTPEYLKQQKESTKEPLQSKKSLRRAEVSPRKPPTKVRNPQLVNTQKQASELQNIDDDGWEKWPKVDNSKREKTSENSPEKQKNINRMLSPVRDFIDCNQKEVSGFERRKKLLRVNSRKTEKYSDSPKKQKTGSRPLAAVTNFMDSIHEQESDDDEEGWEKWPNPEREKTSESSLEKQVVSDESEQVRSKYYVVYPPPPEKFGMVILPRDLNCLKPGKWLNDTIIDFWFRYIYNSCSEEEKERMHVFSSFFCTILKQVDNEKKSLTSLSDEKEDKYQRVSRWTKNVQLFKKDFLIFPVNYSHHWFLIVVCFLGRRAQDIGEEELFTSTSEEDDDDDDEERANISTSYEENNQGEQPVSKPFENMLKIRPCILVFDSLSNKRQTTVGHLRRFFEQEYEHRLGMNICFNNKSLPVLYPKVPQQDNCDDCGVFVMQFMETFCETLLNDFEVPIATLEHWFSKHLIKEKRSQLRSLLEEIHHEQESKGQLEESMQGILGPYEHVFQP